MECCNHSIGNPKDDPAVRCTAGFCRSVIVAIGSHDKPRRGGAVVAVEGVEQVEPAVCIRDECRAVSRAAKPAGAVHSSVAAPGEGSRIQAVAVYKTIRRAPEVTRRSE